MAIKYYTNINLNTNQIENIGIHRGDAFPAAPTSPDPVIGQLFYLTSDTTGFDVGLYVYNGSKWKPVAFGTNFYASYPTVQTDFIPGDTLLRDSASTPEADRGLWICKTKYKTANPPAWTSEKTNWEFLSDTTYCGPYTPGTSYAAGQVVTYNDHVYVANKTITNAPTALNPADWSLSGSNYTGTFSNTALYSYGEMVEYNGNKYICTTAITTAAAWDATKWERIETSLWRGDYSTSNTYFKNELVNYGGVIYVAKEDITTAEAWTEAHWDKLLSNDYRGAWAASTAYVKGEKVQQDGTLYVCKTSHSSSATFDTANWDAIARGTSWPTFSSTKDYAAGDVFIQDGVTYIAPGAVAAGTFDASKFNSLYSVFKGEYNSSNKYQKADEVGVTDSGSGKTTYYVCIGDNVTGDFDTTKWQKLGGDEQYKGEAIVSGKASIDLAIGDIFKYEDKSVTPSVIYYFEVISPITKDEAFTLTDISKVSILSPKVIKQTVTLIDGTLTGTITLPLGAQLIEVKTVDTTSKARVVVEETYTEETSDAHATVVFTANIAAGSTESITCTVSYI